MNRAVREFSIGKGRVFCVAFGGKYGKHAVSCGDDGLGRLWGLPEIRPAAGEGEEGPSPAP